MSVTEPTVSTVLLNSARNIRPSPYAITSCMFWISWKLAGQLNWKRPASWLVLAAVSMMNTNGTTNAKNETTSVTASIQAVAKNFRTLIVPVLRTGDRRAESALAGLFVVILRLLIAQAPFG